jgi:centromeric protein E
MSTRTVEFAPRSARSSTATIDASHLNRASSTAGSIRSFRVSTSTTTGVIAEATEGAEAEEEDSHGENGDGTATQTMQIHALQADLADRNRYIQTLEKRLLQARRSSHSRVSMQFSPRFGTMSDETSTEAQLREKDNEIAELRARLDDKERMVSALRSAARKREMADLSLDMGSTQPGAKRSSSGSGSNTSSGVFSATKTSTSKSSAASPVVGTLTPVGERKSKNVDEMTRLLDEMITERVQSGASGRFDSGGHKKKGSGGVARTRLSGS